MKNKICQLASFIILCLGIIALAFLVGARANHVIDSFQFFIGIAIAFVFTYLDAKWIDKHFVDGDWV